jgi:hypothetical protein
MTTDELEVQGAGREEEGGFDEYRNSAKDALTELFRGNPNRAYFLKQLEVKLERIHSHWVTARAMNDPIRGRFLRFEEVPLSKETSVKFVFRKGRRYYKREVERLTGVVRWYSRPEI